MTHIRTVAIIAIILTLLTAPIFSFSAHGMIDGSSDPTPGTPGEIYWSSNSKDSEMAKETTIQFTQNDAYLSGAVNFIYEFQSSVWNNLKNQRVTIDVWIRNGTDGTWSLNNGWGWGICENGVQEIPDEAWKQIISARMIQYESWRDTQARTNITGMGNTNYTTPSMVEVNRVVIDPASGRVADSLHYRFTFFVNSSSFRPGVFAIEIIVKAWKTDFWGNDKEEWQSFATIYGEFTYGEAVVDTHHPPNDSILPDENGHFPPAYFNFTIHEGWWRVKFWYVGNGTEWHENNGEINGTNVKLLKVWPSETGYFDKNSGESGYIKLQYNYTDNDTAGEYVWQLLSINSDGDEILYSWTLVVHNNMDVLDTNDDGIIDNYPPVVRISFKTNDEQPEVNKDITIVIHAWDNDSGESIITVYLYAYYSNNIYQAPPPDLNTMQLFHYPVEIDAPNGTKEITVQLRYGGQFNVVATVKDSYGAFSKDMAYIMVKDFQGTGFPNNNDSILSWLQLPWDSMLNLILFFIGVILILAGKSTVRLFGIAFLIASFINWSLVWQYLISRIDKLFPWIIERWYL